MLYQGVSVGWGKVRGKADVLVGRDSIAVTTAKLGSCQAKFSEFTHVICAPNHRNKNQVAKLCAASPDDADQRVPARGPGWRPGRPAAAGAGAAGAADIQVRLDDASSPKFDVGYQPPATMARMANLPDIVTCISGAGHATPL